MTQTSYSLPPLAAQGVGLIEDRRDLPLFGEGRKGYYQFFKKFSRYAPLACAARHSTRALDSHTVLAKKMAKKAIVEPVRERPNDMKFSRAKTVPLAEIRNCDFVVLIAWRDFRNENVAVLHIAIASFQISRSKRFGNVHSARF